MLFDVDLWEQKISQGINFFRRKRRCWWIASEAVLVFNFWMELSSTGRQNEWIYGKSEGCFLFLQSIWIKMGGMSKMHDFVHHHPRICNKNNNCGDDILATWKREMFGVCYIEIREFCIANHGPRIAIPIMELQSVVHNILITLQIHLLHEYIFELPIKS